MRLSAGDIAHAEEFAKQIDLSDTMAVLKYGNQAQNHVSSYTDHSLSDLPQHDYEEISADLNKLKKKLNAFEKELLSSSELYRDSEKAFSSYKSVYERIVSAVNETARRLEIHRQSLLRHMNRLDDHYDRFLTCIREFDMYIYAGQLCLNSTAKTRTDELLKRAQSSGLKEDLLTAQDYQNNCARLERRLSDLSLSRQLPFQLCTQIRMMQNTDAVHAETLHSMCANSFPLFKSRLILALGLGEEKVFDAEIVKESFGGISSTMDSVMRAFVTSKQKQKKSLSDYFRSE